MLLFPVLGRDAAIALESHISTFSSEQILAVNIISLVASGLSFIGTTCIISSYLFVPYLRTPFRRLIMYLAITDLASSILWLLSVIVDKLDVLNDDYSLVCSILGPLQVYFYLASFVWTAIIGPPPNLTGFLCLISSHSSSSSSSLSACVIAATETLRRFRGTTVGPFGEIIVPTLSRSPLREIVYHAIAWLLPAPIIVYPTVKHHFGENIMQCVLFSHSSPFFLHA